MIQQPLERRSAYQFSRTLTPRQRLPLRFGFQVSVRPRVHRRPKVPKVLAPVRSPGTPAPWRARALSGAVGSRVRIVMAVVGGTVALLNTSFWIAFCLRPKDCNPPHPRVNSADADWCHIAKVPPWVPIPTPRARQAVR